MHSYLPTLSLIGKVKDVFMCDSRFCQFAYNILFLSTYLVQAPMGTTPEYHAYRSVSFCFPVIY